MANTGNNSAQTTQSGEGEVALTEQQIQEEQRIQSQQTKCTGCGSNMNFDIETGSLKCKHCGTFREFEDTEKVQRRALTNDLLTKHEKWDEARVLKCSNCGATEVMNRTDLAIRCSFCGSAKITGAEDLPGIKPDSVIPFQITPEAANQRFRKWIKGKFFAPRSFKRADVQERMHKIYTPCWSFTSKTVNVYNGTLGRTVTTHTKNGTTTRTHWFRVNGAIHKHYTDVFFQSGSRISSLNFNRLKPYNLQQVRVYRQEYLSGIIAEHYSKTLETCLNEFSQFVKADIRRDVMRKHNADTVSHLSIMTTFNDRHFNYVLLPVYVSNYTYKEKLFNFYVNGATGKIVGRYPKSGLKIFAIVAGVMIGIGGIAAVLLLSGIF